MNSIKIKKNKYKHNKGFTLVETLVSLALFSIVLVISGGVILSVINSNKKNQAIASVVSNLNYSLDSMIRDIKTGYLYKCGTYNGSMTIEALKSNNDNTFNQCNDSSSIILISTISGNDVVVKYEFKNPGDSNGYIEKTVYTLGVASLYNITDKNNVNIKSVNFTIKNPDSRDCHPNCSYGEYGQPSVFVAIKGLSGSELIDASRFYVQTFISQRFINTTNFKK
jgi:prepilin-type N-terminal cleavage/methylation domain-containing protein